LLSLYALCFIFLYFALFRAFSAAALTFDRTVPAKCVIWKSFKWQGSRHNSLATADSPPAPLEKCGILVNSMQFGLGKQANKWGPGSTGSGTGVAKHYGIISRELIHRQRYCEWATFASAAFNWPTALGELCLPIGQKCHKNIFGNAATSAAGQTAPGSMLMLMLILDMRASCSSSSTSSRSLGHKIRQSMSQIAEMAVIVIAAARQINEVSYSAINSMHNRTRTLGSRLQFCN